MSGDSFERPSADTSEERHITVAGQVWIVRAGGAGLTGTGRWGLAPVEAVHFYRAGETRPAYEALVERGRWRELYDGELAALLARAVVVPPAG